MKLLPIKNTVETFVYILADKRNVKLSTGITNSLKKKDYLIKKNLFRKFSGKYDRNVLVYYEIHESFESAVTREKDIKRRSRKKKIQLIESLNAKWQDLSRHFYE